MAKMASFFNPVTSMYCQQQQQQAAAAAAASNSQQLNQHPQSAHNNSQQQATGVGVGGEGDPQYGWYSYPHPHHHHHHHQTSAAQNYHSDVLVWPSHAHAHHYSHLHCHQAAYQHHQQPHPTQINQTTEWSGDEGNNNGVGTSEPSPPITVSGSEISSPGTPSSPTVSNNNNNNNNSNNTNNNNNNNINAPNHNTNSTRSVSSTPMRPTQMRSPYEWLKKPSYQSQPNPGKTRTKDKYRVVYTDHQRVELEKEFHFSRYITIKRKAELAANLSLSERQVKIWFQNRRAKERKQQKKRGEEMERDIKPDINALSVGMSNLAAMGGMSGMLSGLMHTGASSPSNHNAPPHSLTFGHPSSSLHSHTQHAHTVLGL